ncbi:MAG: AraC family transcriptional regulator [Alphaproteobacteria bacterium]
MPTLTRTDRNEIRPRSAFIGIDAVDAAFSNHAYSPHRHDTYTIGYTKTGVQRFRYRGEERAALPGDVFVLHPDELHDGRPGTDAGYSYRAVYLPPGLVLRDGQDEPLPYIEGGVVRAADLARAVDLFFDAEGTPFDLAEAQTGITDALRRHGDGRNRPVRKFDYDKIDRIRRALAEDSGNTLSLHEIETLFDIDRFTLCRSFRQAFGIAPSRFVMMRRLARAKRTIEAGSPLAEAAIAAGFADQSHMTRQFRKAYGLSPGQWRSFLAKEG